MKEHTTESQCSAILEHLKKGLSITPLEALSLCGCFRLAARIHDLMVRRIIQTELEKLAKELTQKLEEI